MDYSPKQPEHNVNVSPAHPLTEFFPLLAAAITIFSVVAGLAGLLVDRAVTYIDPELESELFAGSPAQYNFDMEAPSDRTAFLQDLADELRICMEMPYPNTLTVAASPQMNAFAIPGGHIVMFSGLIDGMSSENGLAFVLAHELAHFKHRDHLRGLGRGVVLVAASAVVSGSSSALTSMLTPAVSLGAASYSQAREAAADAAALEALHCKYGDVGGAEELFHTLEQVNDADIWSDAHYFSSHPEMGERIQSLQQLAEDRQLASGTIALVPCHFCGH